MSTIVVDENPVVLSVEYPQLYTNLVSAGFYGDLPGCFQPCGQFGANTWDRFIITFEETFPGGRTGNTFVFFDSAFPSVNLPVPEPATWLLLLLGFAAVALVMRAGRAQRAGARRPGWKPGRHLLPIPLKRL